MKPLKAGSGGVRCMDCGARAAADGKGSPIVLKHMDGCPEAVRLVYDVLKDPVGNLISGRPTQPTRWADIVAALDAIVGDRPERDHQAADDLLLVAVPVEVADAYRRLKERAHWWATA